MADSPPWQGCSLLGHPLRHFGTSIGDATCTISQTPRVSVDFQVFEIEGALEFTWDYLSSLFPDGLIADMFDVYCRVLHQLADGQSAPARGCLAAQGVRPARRSRAAGPPDADRLLPPARRAAAGKPQHTPQAQAIDTPATRAGISTNSARRPETMGQVQVSWAVPASRHEDILSVAGWPAVLPARRGASCS